MLVVSDATPLISIMKAERLDTLGKLFGEVLIPCAVYSELTSNPRFRDEAEQIEGSAFIKVVEVEERATVDVLRRATGLDLGESEAIVYADGAGADVLLMDESRGRQVARQMGLYIMGTIGVLLYSHEQGVITSSEARDALERLRRANRHISEELFEYAISKI